MVPFKMAEMVNFMLCVFYCNVKFVLLGYPFPGPLAKRADLSHECVGLPAPRWHFSVAQKPRELTRVPFLEC